MHSSKLSPNRSALLEARAHTMRWSMTRSEDALWQQLRGRRLFGVLFRRQAVVGKHIVDFLAPRARLIVEVDEGYHVRRAAADARRDRKLRRHGYRVLRLGAELVLHQLPVALSRVRHELETCTAADSRS
jgi:very-short-patch-repair endonuclease